jgi:hypothetical protein
LYFRRICGSTGEPQRQAGGADYSVTSQDDDFPNYCFQVWSGGSNITGNEGAGYVMFQIVKHTS